MNAARLAVGSAITTVVAWGLKAVAIGLAGGLDKSPLEGPLFLVGLVAISVAFVALGVAIAEERPVATKIIGGIVAVVVGVGLSALASWVAAAVLPRSVGWVRAEAGLWLAALFALVLTTSWYARQRSVRAVA